jgi:tRNA(Ile)-lysidine synthase
MLQRNLETTVEDFFHTHCAAPCSVCVAVSGGGDSTALFYLLKALQKRLSIIRLGVAHVNHRIRGAASFRDAAFVKRLAKAGGAAFHLRKVDKSDVPDRSVEEWARNLRYGFFAEIKREYAYTYVATAHTQNDQAETVLLRLLRGSGVHGLCGIEPVRKDGIIRPLLNANGRSIRAWLSTRNITFCEDATNADTSYARNWVRHRVVPLLERRDPAAVSHLAAAAANAQIADRIMAPVLNKWINDNVVFSGRDRFLVKRAGLAGDPVAAEAIVRLFADKGIGFDRYHIGEIFRNAPRASGVFLLPGKWEYSCGKRGLEFAPIGQKEEARSFRCPIVREKTVLCSEAHCTISAKLLCLKRREKPSFADPMTAHLDAAACCGPLVLRSLERDDRFWPYGAKGFVDCREFLKKQGIPAGERKNINVVARRPGEIVWVVGVRTAHQFRVTRATRAVLQISFRPMA